MMRGGKVKDAYKKADQDIAKSSSDFYKDIYQHGDPMIDINRVGASLDSDDFFDEVDLFNAKAYLDKF